MSSVSLRHSELLPSITAQIGRVRCLRLVKLGWSWQLRDSESQRGLPARLQEAHLGNTAECGSRQHVMRFGCQAFVSCRLNLPAFVCHPSPSIIHITTSSSSSTSPPSPSPPSSQVTWRPSSPPSRSCANRVRSSAAIRAGLGLGIRRLQSNVVDEKTSEEPQGGLRVDHGFFRPFSIFALWSRSGRFHFGLLRKLHMNSQC